MSEPAISPVAARWIRRWLVIVGLMVYAMILIGGATRLTDSGLSITEWEPLKGALPPLSDGKWASEFAKYRETAEYQMQNKGMSMAEFQTIYWWEWGHRFFGRMVGLVAILGLVIFAVKRWLTRPLAMKLLALIVLGGLQGAIGWWMVSSGIGETSRVDVAPYRLMTHFTLALLILCFTAWIWLDLKGDERVQTGRGRGVAKLLLFAIFVQMAAGALVAGLDAGRTYTDWPLMAGELIPRHYLEADLGLRSLFEGRAAVQFNHRLLAYAIWIGSLVAALRYRHTGLGRDFAVLAALVSAQAIWGILTLMKAAPMSLALVHQGLGVIVTLWAVRLVWRASRPA